jgi:hypothetical protein
MKTIYTLTRLILLLSVSFNVHAQSLERRVIASGGTSVAGPLQVDYTIGEISVETVKVSQTVILTQGFQQPTYVVIPGNNVFPYLVIYPNPTTGTAIVRFVLSRPGNMTISIYDALGQLMSKEAIDYTGGEMQYIIKSSGFKQGSYFIRFTMEDGEAASAKLVKLQ